MTAPTKLLFGLDAVPIGRVAMDARQAPEPFRSQFVAAMKGQAQPLVTDAAERPIRGTFYVSDWLEWASGNWRWGDRPNPDV